jgi:hypothetical protein
VTEPAAPLRTFTKLTDEALAVQQAKLLGL